MLVWQSTGQELIRYLVQMGATSIRICTWQSPGYVKVSAMDRRSYSSGRVHLRKEEEHQISVLRRTEPGRTDGSGSEGTQHHADDPRLDDPGNAIQLRDD